MNKCRHSQNVVILARRVKSEALAENFVTKKWLATGINYAVFTAFNVQAARSTAQKRKLSEDF